MCSVDISPCELRVRCFFWIEYVLLVPLVFLLSENVHHCPECLSCAVFGTHDTLDGQGDEPDAVSAHASLPPKTILQFTYLEIGGTVCCAQLLTHFSMWHCEGSQSLCVPEFHERPSTWALLPTMTSSRSLLHPRPQSVESAWTTFASTLQSLFDEHRDVFWSTRLLLSFLYTISLFSAAFLVSVGSTLLSYKIPKVFLVSNLAGFCSFNCCYFLLNSSWECGWRGLR